jgi:GT2 family glycosyltransferase
MDLRTSTSIEPPRQIDETVPDFSVVLVCWNNREYLEPCLHSLFEGNLESSFDVVVVDNGSTDGSQSMLRENFSQVKIIQNDHNVGLGKASNQGIEATSGRYVLLLNNDTLVNGQSLDAMVDFLDLTPEGAAVGGILLNPDGSFQSGYADFSTLIEEFLIASSLGGFIWAGYPLHHVSDQPVEAGWLSSACLMLRREALGGVGLLDDEYFIYGDEVDLQFRLHKAGWKTCFLPSVTTIHYGGRSMDRWRRRKMVYRGKILFYEKNYGWFRTAILRVMIAISSLAKIAIWAFLSVSSRRDEKSRNELRSNLEVLRLCWHE